MERIESLDFSDCYLMSASLRRLPIDAGENLWPFGSGEYSPHGLYTYSCKGTLTGYRALRAIECIVPQFWEKKALGCFFSEAAQTIGVYSFAYLVIKIDPKSLKEIFGLGRYELGKEMDALFTKVDPNDASIYRSNSSDWPKYPSLIYLRSNPLFDYSSDDYVHQAKERAQLISATLNHSSRILPHLLIDTILFPPLVPTGPESQLIAVGLSLKPGKVSEREDIYLNRTALDALDYMIYFSILKDLNRSIDRVPFVKEQLASYVSQIRNPSLISSTRTQKNTQPRQSAASILDAYEQRFLNDRVQASLERDAVSFTRSSIADKFKVNLVAQADRWQISHTIDSVDVNDTPAVKTDVIDELAQELTRQSSDLTKNEELVKSRESALADFLRDLAITDSARVNLGLQRNVWILTKLAMVLALVSVVIALLTEERKRLIGNALWNWVKGVWIWLRQTT